jgi:FixJ family two-component response regulator
MTCESTSFVVAVVDDDSRTLESLADLLEAAGYEVRLFSSGIGAWNHGGWSDIDCLISDVGMPDMNGFELRRLALSVRPELPVFLITGRSEFRAQYSAVIERDRYFEKPYDGQQLLAAIRTALDNARPKRDT